MCVSIGNSVKILPVESSVKKDLWVNFAGQSNQQTISDPVLSWYQLIRCKLMPGQTNYNSEMSTTNPVPMATTILLAGPNLPHPCVES